MNIFVVDEDPIKAAQSLCDAHVVKMIVESCQLLSTQDRLDNLTEGRYKSTHVNHPCRKCLEDYFNWVWLKLHLEGLLQEYTYRFEKVHKCQQMFDSFWKVKWALIPPLLIEMEGISEDPLLRSKVAYWTHFPQCMPDEYKVAPSIATCISGSIRDNVIAYRNYYKYKAKTLKRFTYTKRELPEWL